MLAIALAEFAELSKANDIMEFYLGIVRCLTDTYDSAHLQCVIAAPHSNVSLAMA